MLFLRSLWVDQVLTDDDVDNNILSDDEGFQAVLSEHGDQAEDHAGASNYPEELHQMKEDAGQIEVDSSIATSFSHGEDNVALQDSDVITSAPEARKAQQPSVEQTTFGRNLFKVRKIFQEQSWLPKNIYIVFASDFAEPRF